MSARFVGGWALALAGCAAAAADEPEVALKLVAPSLTAGEPGALSVTVAPGPGKTVSADGPLRLTIEPGDDGVTVSRRRYARKDAADPQADAPRFDVKLKARAAGEHPVTVEARLWLCGPSMCRPVQLRRTVTVTVTAPPIDAGVDAPIDAGPVDAGPRRRRSR